MKKIVAVFMAVCLMLTATAALAAPLKVALVVAGALGDKSFYDSANAGIEKAKAEFGKVGVLGAGMMGAGIALACARAAGGVITSTFTSSAPVPSRVRGWP